MTDRATIRAWIERDPHRPAGDEQLIDYLDQFAGELLIGNRQLIAELAETRKHARIAVAQSVRLATALADAHADRERLIAAILRPKQEPRIPMDAWYAYATVLEMARGTKLGLRGGERPEDVQDAPQPHPEPPQGAPVMDFPSEALESPQRPAGGVEPYRCPTPCDPDCEAPCHEGHEVSYKQRHDVQGCGKRVALGALLPTAPIAPEDEGISTADALAQAANDAAQPPASIPVELRRRTPAERLAYLAGQRDQYIARGLPAELIDAMIADAESEQQ